MATDFFSLRGASNTDIDANHFFSLVAADSETIENCIYRPDVLEPPPSSNSRWRIKSKLFLNFSFSKTAIQKLEFTDCTFKDCLFIGSRISDCRFTNCKFLNSNMYRCEFYDVYINPRSFDQCIVDKQYSNIAVFLYQELLFNSRRAAQPDFADDALYMFRKWKIIQHAKDKSITKARIIRDTLSDLVFRLLLGYGVRVGNLALSALLILLFATATNWVFRIELGLDKIGPAPQGFIDAFYFTVVVMTTLGFGDITPVTQLGKALVSLQALIGFLLLATFASMIFRKISQ